MSHPFESFPSDLPWKRCIACDDGTSFDMEPVLPHCKSRMESWVIRISHILVFQQSFGEKNARVRIGFGSLQISREFRPEKYDHNFCCCWRNF